MLLVVCQLSRDVIGYEDSQCHWCVSIRLLSKLKVVYCLVRQIVVCTATVTVDYNSMVSTYLELYWSPHSILIDFG